VRALKLSTQLDSEEPAYRSRAGFYQPDNRTQKLTGAICSWVGLLFFARPIWLSSLPIISGDLPGSSPLSSSTSWPWSRRGRLFAWPNAPWRRRRAWRGSRQTSFVCARPAETAVNASHSFRRLWPGGFPAFESADVVRLLLVVI
jgi:hypothetical protein